MTGMAGASVLSTMTATEYTASGKAWGLGDEYTAYDGTKYIFTLAASAITVNRVCLLAHDNATAAMVTATTANAGGRLGVALVAIASGDYGWLQVYGPCTGIRVAASCVGGVLLLTTATAGVLDDAAGTDVCNGIVITTTVGGAEATAAGVLNYPFIGIVA